MPPGFNQLIINCGPGGGLLLITPTTPLESLRPGLSPANCSRIARMDDGKLQTSHTRRTWTTGTIEADLDTRGDHEGACEIMNWKTAPRDARHHLRQPRTAPKTQRR